MGKFLMPSLGSDMESGVLIEWEKQPGDPVQKGDVIAVVETDKGAIEIEVYESGFLDSILVQLGEKVPVGTPLAVIRNDEGSTEVDTHVVSDSGDSEVTLAKAHKSADIRISSDTDDAAARTEPHVSSPPVSPKAVTDIRTRATPAARKLARDLGVELKSVSASGPDGAIVLADVRAFSLSTSTEISSGAPVVASADKVSGDAIAPLSADKGSRSTIDADRMRIAIAAAMSRSKKEIPHYYLSNSVNMSAAIKYVADENASRDPSERLLLSAILIKAVATSLATYGEFNGFYVKNRFQQSDAVHLGMAINIRGGGLVAPAIHHANQLSINDIMQALRDLVSRVRKGRYRASELNDPTITLSSLGERGVDTLYGVVFPPQVAIIGSGTVSEQPIIQNSEVVTAPMLTMTMSADHRVSDGHRGALFLKKIAHHLQNPEQL